MPISGGAMKDDPEDDLGLRVLRAQSVLRAAVSWLMLCLPLTKVTLLQLGDGLTGDGR